MNEAFAELRQTLNQAPSTRVWEELLKTLAEWPEPQTFSLALEYAVQHLRSWPSEFCILTIEALNSPLLPLAKGLRWASGLDGPGVGQALSGARELTWLPHLNLYHRWLGSRGVQFVALYSPHLASLTHLELRYNEIDARGASLLARSRYLDELECLDLSGNPLRSVGIRKLCSVSFVQKLRILRLQDCSVDAAALSCLLDTGFPNLEELSLANGEFRQEELVLFEERAFLWPRLKTLDLRYCLLSEEWKSRLKAMNWPSTLETLRL